MLRCALLLFGLLAAWFIANAILMRRTVNRELFARGLKRVSSQDIVLVNPAPGSRVVETCICDRGAERVLVIVLAAGWFSHRLDITERPVA